MTTWFTSDTHFWHKNIIAYQPNRQEHWHDVEEMNEGIIDRWNSVVGVDDFVWHLGDYDMNGKPKALEFVQRLNGTIGLVAGNHDKCHPLFHRTPTKLRLAMQQYLNAGFAFVVQSAATKVAGTDVLLSHFPYAGDSGEADRHDQWRLRYEGEWLLHGHTHNPDQRLHFAKQIHVGQDAWDNYPVSEEQIEELMHG